MIDESNENRILIFQIEAFDSTERMNLFAFIKLGLQEAIGNGHAQEVLHNQFSK